MVHAPLAGMVKVTGFPDEPVMHELRREYEAVLLENLGW